MNTKCATVKNRLRARDGMTLTEVLVALAILTIAIMCFLPLAQSSFKNIYLAGEKTKSNYKDVGLIERLIGNTGANGDYEVSTADVPLLMQARGVAIQSNSSSLQLQSIDGVSITSTPENPGAGFSTFICDSVTAKMVCYPSHISDDFLTKTITLYASGFRFSSVNEFKIYYTDSSGNRQPVPGTYNKSNPYCQLEIDKNNASVVYLTLKGDNDVIRFENSPLVIEYRVYSLTVEIDAPTVIMVGEEAEDGNYYYYVTSGEPDEDGNLDIIRKKMNSTDPLGKISGNITLTSAMNDVEWVAAGEGDNGYGGTNTYGYYVMCGDNGQIRRFWKNPTTGNYGWGGDYTIAHEYYYNDGDSYETNQKMYSTTVDSSYAYYKDPTKNIDDKTDDAWGINLIPQLDPNVDSFEIYNKLYTQTAFSINALAKHNLDVYTAGNVLFAYRRTDLHNNNAWNEVKAFSDAYINRNDVSGTWMDIFQNGGGGYNNSLLAGNVVLKLYNFNHKNATVKRSANDMISYKDYYGLDKDTDNYITLTSVDAVTMQNTYSGNKYPTQSYTLYCGYIPAVMDLWATNLGVAEYANYNFGEWRATLGLAFRDNEKESIQLNAAKYFAKVGPIFRGWVKSWGTTYYMDFDGYLWRYSAAKASNYALSGVCGPSNYDPAQTVALTDSLAMAASAPGFGKALYPLNTSEWQDQMQKMNTTTISVAYLSHPYALSGEKKWHNIWDQAPDRGDNSGVFEWEFGPSTTIMDTDSIYYEDYDGNSGYYSIAVGYYVGGLVYENQSNKMISVPTVMNIGKVYLRAGGAGGSTDDDGLGTGYTLQQESNVFNEFYNTNDYWHIDRANIGGKFTMHQSVSAGYWRDAYHLLFYSNYGGSYDPNNDRDKYSYIMAHILQDKKLNAVSWGMTWNESPEAMWGASDGTLMSWYLDLDALQKGNAAANDDRSITCEFQSYQKLEYNNLHNEKYGTTEFTQHWRNEVLIWQTTKFKLPLTTAEMGTGSATENYYWDKCSVQLGDTANYGFISPLDTIEDVAYANDTWVACGVQGVANPMYMNVAGKVVGLCKSKAVVKRNGASDEGSWICVRTWYDKSNGKDKGPVDGNCNFIWQAVQISQIKNCNIQQVTYCNGMWYAVGYIDSNDNGQYDYTVSNGQQREHAVVFYAVDPSQPCGTEKGWRLSDNGNVGYTQAWANDGTGNYKLLNIDGVNSVASRND